MNRGIKHSIRLGLLGLALVPVSGSAFFADRVYCVIQTGAIQVTLQKDSHYLCQDYIHYLGYHMQILANNVTMSNQYVQAGQDVAYWTGVQLELEKKFTAVSVMKSSIETAVATFESQLLAKVQDYLRLHTEQYLTILYSQQEALDNWPGAEPVLEKRREMLAEQIVILQTILEVSNFDTLMPLLSRYLYLRKKLIGQLAL